MRFDASTILRVARGLLVTLLPAWFFAGVFRVSEEPFLGSGLGDWLDPYFINAVLEHWWRSLLHLADPSSPLMYFPVTGTLGYSASLILYVPFYVVVRPFVHPFHAQTLTIFLTLETGSICLYLVIRKFARLGFLASLLLTTFLYTSRNLVNSTAGHFSQRFSVFLIPPIILIALEARRAPLGPAKVVLCGLAGFLGTLMLSQDFYTAAFGILVASLLFVGVLPPALRDLRRRAASWQWRGALNRPTVGVAAGIAAGSGMFLWLYLRSIFEHSVFPVEQLVASLVPVDTDFWRSAGSLYSGLETFQTLRPFKFVAAIALLSWLPYVGLDARARIYTGWFFGVSLLVIFLPVRFDDFSIWMRFLHPIPGLSVVRDPKRIIETYELAIVLTVALLMKRTPMRSPFRVAVTLVAGLLVAQEKNPETFTFNRPIYAYHAWVEGPILVAPSCRSFFVKPASTRYTSRFDNSWSLYGVDAFSIAMRTGIPTLNGYSAWAPEDWRLSNPQDPGYMEGVDRWTSAHGLTDVCALDLDDRSMKPWQP